MTGSNNHYSLISLNINGFNSSMKRYKLIDWIWKQDPTFCCIQETHLSVKDKNHLRVKGLEDNFTSKCSQETSRSSHSNIR